MMIRLIIAALVILVSGCSKEPVTYREEEIGYKGVARVDPWLASRRFLEAYGEDVLDLRNWRKPDYADSVWFVPAHTFVNESFVSQAEEWIRGGGHLICLVDHTMAGSDWSKGRGVSAIEPAAIKFLQKHEIDLESSGPSVVTSAIVSFEGNSYEVESESVWRLRTRGGEPTLMTSLRLGEGRLTVLADARPFRNRWIAEKQHADLLKALVESTQYGGFVAFVRGAPPSLWTLLWERAWAALIGVGVVILVVLWKNLPRFGPLEAAEAPSPLRGYDYHLEALGDFQWRLDKGASLLAPIREEIIERSQRHLARAGRLDEDVFAALAERAGITRERAYRALVEPAPADGFIFTRTVADLQSILKTLA
jgi:hypothetical protein